MLILVTSILIAAVLSAGVIVLCIAAVFPAWRAGPAYRGSGPEPRAVPWRVWLAPLVLGAALIAGGIALEAVPDVVRLLALLTGLGAFAWLRAQQIRGMGDFGRGYKENPRTWLVPPRVAPEQRGRVAALVILGVFGVLLVAVGYIVGRSALAGVFG